MRNSAQFRINDYNKRLPRLKEKLFTMLILLLVAFTMLTTVSFAWVALSINPEVSSISTAIASNGNLEIALASGSKANIQAPGPSQIGDGATDKSFLEKNLTWGNLINLSDPKYGLNNLVLRPAYLNEDNLINSPLIGAKYTEDGRHNGYMSDFQYAQWIPGENGAPGEFTISNNLGVRAISSTIMAASEGYAYDVKIMKGKVEEAMQIARDAYLVVTNSQSDMETLAYIMGVYMTANMNKSEANAEHLTNPTMDVEKLQNFKDLFGKFMEILLQEREALRQLANLQLYILAGGDSTSYVPYANTEALVAGQSEFAAKGVQLQGLAENVSDYNKLEENYAKLVEICEQGSSKWNDDKIYLIVDALVTVGTCTCEGTPVNKIGASAALNLNNKSCDVVITNGIIYNFEKRSGAKMEVGRNYNNGKGLLVEAKGKRAGIEMGGKIYAIITTNAPSPSLYQQDLSYADEKNTGGAVDLRANDTYGLAIDFWIRTNASGSFLTLEGNVLTETTYERAMGKDNEGNEVELYTVTVQQTDEASGETVDITIDLYKKVEGETTTWYDADTHVVLEPETPPTEKMNEITTVIGYEGDNRVWDDGNAFLATDATTQGSGSCYVFYTETPEDQARSLELLKSMKIAFVDASGELLASAYMDTEHYFVDSGKVIVPIVLGSDAISLGTDSQGIENKAIMPLEQNVATLVTAIVYLDGTNLENDDVLAAADIQGQLNVQFGSSVDLKPITDEKLASEYMTISATLDEDSFNYDTATEDMTTNITVNITGSTPTTVTAFFIRSISSTQGIPMNGADDIITFTNQGDGTWLGSYTFTTPGRYILRSIVIDGVEKDLDVRPEVTVAGFALYSLSFEGGGTHKDFMTAANSVSTELDLVFATNDPFKMPKVVEGRFMNDEDGTSVTINFTRNATNNIWSGSATFLTSGNYTLKYLVLDGEYMEIAEAFKKTASVTLGMKVAVYTDSPLSFLFGAGLDGDFDNGMEDNEENLYMKVKVTNDNDEEMMGLSGVKLYYSFVGYDAEAYGLDADLTWNGNTGYYEGAFASKPGMFAFLRVTVDSNVISNASTSPVFQIISPTPPSFGSGNTFALQYKPDPANDPAYITVILKDADAIPGIVGIIVDANDNEHEVKGEVSNAYFRFKVPITANSQDGTWKLKSIRIWGVFDEEGNPYTEEAPLIFDLTDVDGVTTEVFSVIDITMDSTVDVKFKGEAFETHTVEAGTLGLSVKGKDGMLKYDIERVTLTYSYDSGTMREYGGYSGPIDDFEEVLDMTTTDGVNFTHEAFKLVYAGVYNIKVSVTVKFGNETITKTIDLSPITITSATPTAKITEISNYQGKNNEEIDPPHPSEVTVKFGEYTTSTTVCGVTIPYTKYSQPYVEITLTGMGKATKGTMTFSTDSENKKVHLYTKTDQKKDDSVSSYEWLADGTCTRWVGYWESRTGNDSYEVAGTLTSPALILTYNDIEFQIDDTKIIIHNPNETVK